MILSLLKKQALRLRKLRLFYSVLFSSLLFPALAQSEPLLVFLKKNQQSFSFKLKSNPTTGYRWNIESYDPKQLEFIDSHYIAKQPQLMGSGGDEEFVFKRLTQGVIETQIQLRYQRSWEPKEGPVQIVNISNQPEKN